LVTAWNPEPVEFSHLVRFADTKLVFNATWQALQFENWTDEQLARLQREWESATFLTNLPETVAFRRACDVTALEHESEILKSRPPFTEFFMTALQFPPALWSELRYHWRQAKYFRDGRSEDEKNLLLFYRDREIEMRNAVKAITWAQMRGLPGVTNETFYQSKNPGSRFQTILNLRRMNMAFSRWGSSFLGRAAEAEAERRILIAAIALERYRTGHDAYPPTLAALSPEFLKTVPVDFMVGKPLCYRLFGNHFLLYSVGLDCVDNGGEIPSRPVPNPTGIPRGFFGGPARGDIVWPLPASAAQTAAHHEKELKARQEQIARTEEREKTLEEHDEAMRQAMVKKLLAMKPPFNKTDPIFHGEALSKLLQNHCRPIASEAATYLSGLS
jgi:hypothetical protein